MYLELKAMEGLCPTCRVSLGVVPVTHTSCANTPAALQMLRGAGHLVVLSGTRFLVRCQQDQHDRLVLAPGVGPAAEEVARPGLLASAAKQPQGARRR